MCRVLTRIATNTDISTFTVGGQAASTTVTSYIPAFDTSIEIFEFHWDETAIAAMSGTAVSYTDNVSATNVATMCFTVENTSQSALGTFTGTSNVSASSANVTSTNNTDDLVFCSHVAASNAGETLLSSAEWLTIHKGTLDADFSDAGWDASFASAVSDGNAAKDTTTLTFSRTDFVGSACMVFPDDPAPAFTVSPALVDCDSDSCDFDFTLSETGNVHWAAYTTGASAPADCDAVDAGSGAAQAGSEAVTAGVGDGVDITSLMIQHDYYFCGENGSSQQTAVVSVLNQNRDARTGYTIVTNGGLSTTSPFYTPTDTTGDTTADSCVIAGMTATTRFDVSSLVTASAGFAAGVLKVVSKDATSITVDRCATSTQANITVTGLVDRAGASLFNPAIATSDLFELPTATSVAMSTATWDTDLDVVFDGVGSAFASMEFCVQDVSDGTGEFTSPACWTDSTEGAAYLNSTGPVLDFNPPFGSGAVSPLIYVGVPYSINLGDYCTVPTGLTPRVFLRSGYSLMGGGALTDNTLDITALAQDEDGYPLEWWCEGGKSKLYDVRPQTFYITDDAYTAPDCVADTVTPCLSALDMIRPNLSSESQLSATFACSDTVASSDIISQAPAAAGTLTALQALAVVVSTGKCQTGGGRRVGIKIGIGL